MQLEKEKYLKRKSGYKEESHGSHMDDRDDQQHQPCHSLSPLPEDYETEEELWKASPAKQEAISTGTPNSMCAGNETGSRQARGRVNPETPVSWRHSTPDRNKGYTNLVSRRPKADDQLKVVASSIRPANFPPALVSEIPRPFARMSSKTRNNLSMSNLMEFGAYDCINSSVKGQRWYHQWKRVKRKLATRIDHRQLEQLERVNELASGFKGIQMSVTNSSRKSVRKNYESCLMVAGNKQTYIFTTLICLKFVLLLSLPIFIQFTAASHMASTTDHERQSTAMTVAIVDELTPITLQQQQLLASQVPEVIGSSEWLLDNRQLTSVPSESLCAIFRSDFGSHLNMLSLANNNIEQIENGAFKCLGETLRILFLQNNRLTSFKHNDQPFDGLNRLQVLRLSDNLITQIPATTIFEPIKSLRHLDLSQNQIESIPPDAFPKREHDAVLSNLISLNLKGNPIHRLSSHAFIGLSKLKTLTLSETKLNDTNWPAMGFEGLTELRFLYADRMRGDAFRLEQPSDFCVNSPKLSSLYLSNTPNPQLAIKRVLKSNQLEQANQFVHSYQCQSLLLLDLSYNRIGPQLGANQPFRALSNLIDLYLSHNSISTLDETDFSGLTRLQVLELGSNKLVSIHSRSFLPLRNSLVHLDIANNVHLTKLPATGLEQIQTLRCFGNPQLRQLPHFKKARNLMLTFAYHCCDYATKNEAHQSSSSTIESWQIDLHEPSLVTARDLKNPSDDSVNKPIIANSYNPRRNNLSLMQRQQQSGFIALNDLVIWSPQQPEITSTQLPSTAGRTNSIAQVSILRSTKVVKNVRRRREIQLSEAGSSLIECLADEIESIRMSHYRLNNNINDGPSDDPSSLNKIDGYKSINHNDASYHHLEAHRSDQVSGNDQNNDHEELSADQIGQLVALKLIKSTKESRFGSRNRRNLDSSSSSSQSLESESRNNSSAQASIIDCQPKPSAFFPCQDLFDTWWLRLGIWLVFPLGLLGNFLVIVVLVSVKPSSSTSALTSIMWLAHSKRHIDVPRFLVINLAIADLLMALYLGILAIVDLTTCGEFRLYAIKWQYSIGCQVAGFFAILSSELSVFILAIITLERNYAITNAVHLNRRLSLQRAMLIMFLGYTFAIAMALLPLHGVNDYRKFSICLPIDMDPQRPSSQYYVITLLGVNSLSFGLLSGCYLRMYCAIRGSQAWNTNDLRIAKRMSILVLTDFLCWSPIIISALAALFGGRLVDTTGIKIMTIFILPLNSVANPFLYAITTRKFKRDLDNLLYQIRYLVSFGRYAKRPPNTHQININNHLNNHNKHNFGVGGTGNQLQKHPEQSYGIASNKFRFNGQQHIIITCHQNNQQRFRRLKLDSKHHNHNDNNNNKSKEMTENKKEYNIVNGLTINHGSTLCTGEPQHQAGNNTTFNQVTMNQTSCCSNYKVKITSDSNRNTSRSQQAMVYEAIDPGDEHKLTIVDPNDHDARCKQVAMTNQMCYQQPRIVFDDEPDNCLNETQDYNRLTTTTMSNSMAGSRTLAPNNRVSNYSSNNNASINNSLTTSEAGTIKTNSGFSLRSYYNGLNSKRTLPSSTVSVACRGTNDNPYNSRIIQRPKSALGNIPSCENDNAPLHQQRKSNRNNIDDQNGCTMASGFRCRCAYSNDTFHQPKQQTNKYKIKNQNKTGSLGFGGSDDLVNNCVHQFGLNHRDDLNNHNPKQRRIEYLQNLERPLTPLPGQKSGRRRLTLKPLARAWSSLQISLANRNTGTPTPVDLCNNTINHKQQQKHVRSTSPTTFNNYNMNYDNNCCDINQNDEARCRADKHHDIDHLQLIEQSSDDQPKLGFEDLIDLELHLDEIFEATNSPYLLLINPKRLGERRMSKSCETVSHQNSPSHCQQKNDTVTSIQTATAIRNSNKQTLSFDEQQYRAFLASSASSTSGLCQKEKQIRYSTTLQPSEISTTTINTTNTTSSHLDEDDQRVLLATINQLAARSKRSKYRNRNKHANNNNINTNYKNNNDKSGRRESELKLMGNPSRSTRCRSWSPALLGKLEDCIGQIRQRLPAIASSSTHAATNNQQTPQGPGLSRSIANANSISNDSKYKHLAPISKKFSNSKDMDAINFNRQLIGATYCEEESDNSEFSNVEPLVDLGELDEDQFSKSSDIVCDSPLPIAPQEMLNRIPHHQSQQYCVNNQLIDINTISENDKCEQEKQTEVKEQEVGKDTNNNNNSS